RCISGYRLVLRMATRRIRTAVLMTSEKNVTEDECYPGSSVHKKLFNALSDTSKERTTDRTTTETFSCSRRGKLLETAIKM
uniref:Uncharacterized protein n=2 Tax=Parascaris univalens TaxID=6257 RepID=A0A914ZYP0_PARUN